MMFWAWVCILVGRLITVCFVWCFDSWDGLRKTTSDFTVSCYCIFNTGFLNIINHFRCLFKKGNTRYKCFKINAFSKSFRKQVTNMIIRIKVIPFKCLVPRTLHMFYFQFQFVIFFKIQTTFKTFCTDTICNILVYRKYLRTSL